jgi:hypothetical protein
MLRFLADENFNNKVLRGLHHRKLDLDIVRAQDVGLSGANDPTLLQWAADDNRVVLTHDVSTMTKYAYERVKAGQPLPGVFEVSQNISVGTAIDEILCLAECSLEGEWDGQVRYLPLQ